MRSPAIDRASSHAPRARLAAARAARPARAPRRARRPGARRARATSRALVALGAASASAPASSSTRAWVCSSRRSGPALRLAARAPARAPRAWPVRSTSSRSSAAPRGRGTLERGERSRSSSSSPSARQSATRASSRASASTRSLMSASAVRRPASSPARSRASAKRGLQLLHARARVAQLGLEPAPLVPRATLLRSSASSASTFSRVARSSAIVARVSSSWALRCSCACGVPASSRSSRSASSRVSSSGGARPLALLARLVRLGPHLVEHAPRLGELAAQLDDALGRLGELAAGGLGLAARLLELGGRALERALQVLRAAQRRLDRVRDLACRGCRRARSASSSSSSSVGSGAGGSSISGRKATIVPAARSSSSSRAWPPIAALIQSTTVLWLRWSWRSALPRGAAISSASRKPLNSRLWLIPTGMNVSVSSSSVPSLRRATV